jgi:nicotinate-nucleotide adenylyltransferase
LKIGIFGGCFDPIHNGHVSPAREARRVLGLERVIFLPTANPPHKPGRRFAPPMARYAMAELALLDEEGMEVSTFELTPDQPSYTIDSLEHFHRIHQDAQLVLLMGSDALRGLGSWHRWEEITEEFEIGVLSRPDTRPEDVLPHLDEPLRGRLQKAVLHWVPNEPVEASSTELRQLLSTGAPIPDGVVPDLVLKYLQKYPNLYV